VESPSLFIALTQIKKKRLIQMLLSKFEFKPEKRREKTLKEKKTNHSYNSINVKVRPVNKMVDAFKITKF